VYISEGIMSKREPYTCPRCGYNTRLKSNMHKHLYSLKRDCPAQKYALELTPSVKEHIMDNRVYVTKNDTKVITQTIHNYNLINNYIAGLDVFDKLNHITAYKKIEVLDFETHVEDTYHRTVKKLENDGFKHGFMLRGNDFLDIINTLTQAIRGTHKGQFLELLNFMYDNKKKRIKVYAGEQWEEYLVEKGLTYLVDMIASYYLHAYELYLIRKIERISVGKERIDCEKSLEDYYSFIGHFNVDPFIKDKTDVALLGDDEDAYDIAVEDIEAHRRVDYYNKKYQDAYDNITNAQRREMTKRVLDVLKTNSHQSVDQLDKEIIDLIKMDEDFKALITRGWAHI
jgi:hypothetical protein